MNYPKNVKDIKNLNEFIRKAREFETDKYWSNILYDCSSANYADWTRRESRLKWKRKMIQNYLNYKNKVEESNKLEEKALIDWNNYLTKDEVKKFLSKDDKYESTKDIIYSKEFEPRYRDLHNPLQAKFKNSWTRKELVKDLSDFYNFGNLITESKHKIEEKSRNELLAKTKSQTITRYNKAQEYKGFYIRGVDTDELLKKDSLLTINCQVGNYRDQVQMENMLYWVEYEIEERNHDLQVTSKYITQALMDAIDGMNIKVNCDCRRFQIPHGISGNKVSL